MNGLLGNLFGMQEEDPLLAMLPPEQRAQLQSRVRSQGITNLGLALLQAGGPTTTPGGFGSRLGQAGMQAMQANQGLTDAELQRMLTARKIQQEEKQRAERERMLASLPENVRNQIAFGMKPITVGTGERVFDPLTSKEMFRGQDKTDLAPGIIGEYQSGLNLGLIPEGTTLQQYIEMKKPPAPSATAIAGGGASEFEKVAQREAAKSWSAIASAGTGARRTLRDVNKLGSILEKVPTGLTAAAQQVAGNFGINTEGLDNIQAATAIINRLVPQQRPVGSGTMSDADLALFKQSLPRIINQPGGNKKIVDTLKKVNEYLIKEADIADKVLSGEITRQEGTNLLNSLENPLEDVLSQDTTPQLTPRGRRALDKYR